ncbi:MAG TPA: GntR family transcriptional regulator [Clostridiaceae bacterium]|nr:GntR family transcriptional regulator [Clostridiaceae bacterium]
MSNIHSRIVSTVDAVTEALEEDIYSNKFFPGAMITETELTARYGVSRNTVREAIANLINKGILVKVINKGVYVKKVTFSDVKEIFHLRKLFEVKAVSIIGERGTVPDSVIAALNKLKSLDINTEWNSYVAADFGFHTALVDAADSPRLSRLYNTISAEVKLCIYQSRDIMPVLQENYYDHGLIVECLKNKEVDRAMDLISKHIDSAVEHFKEGFEVLNKLNK